MQTKANSFYQKLKAPHYGRIINRYFTKPLEQAHENNKVLAITEFNYSLFLRTFAFKQLLNELN